MRLIKTVFHYVDGSLIERGLFYTVRVLRTAAPLNRVLLEGILGGGVENEERALLIDEVSEK